MKPQRPEPVPFDLPLFVTSGLDSAMRSIIARAEQLRADPRKKGVERRE